MPYVDNSQITPLYANTTPGVVADANVIDPAIAALIVAINTNYDLFTNFIGAIELPIPDQSIVTRHLRNLAVTNPKLAPLAVTADKIADGTITTQKLADMVITAQKIANGTITEPKYASGSVGSRAIANSSVKNYHLDPDILLPPELSIQTEFDKRGVNVQKYGAKGDGVTDDTIAIQNTIDYVSSSGGIVYIPAGTYIVKKILPKSNVIIHGAGVATLLKLSSGVSDFNHVFEINNANNVTIRNLSIDGNKDTQSFYLSGFFTLICKNLTIENVSIKNMYGEGLFIGYTSFLSENVTINNVVIENCTRNELVLGNCKNVKIKGVTINSDSAFSACVDIEKHSNSDVHENIHLEDIYVNASAQGVKIISNSYTSGKMKNIYIKNLQMVGTVKNISISEFDNVMLDLCFGKFEIIGSKSTTLKSVESRGNTGIGIYAYSSASLRNTEFLTIYNSDISLNSNHGLLLQDCINVIVNENRIYNNGQAGIGIYFVTKNVSITANVITDTRTTGKTQPYAVKYQSTTHDNILIEGNYMIGNLSGDYDGIVVNKTLNVANISLTDRASYKFISPDGVNSHSFSYGDDLKLTFGAFLGAKRLFLSQQYASASVGNGQFFEDSADGKPKYKNLAGTVYTLTT